MKLRIALVALVCAAMMFVAGSAYAQYTIDSEQIGGWDGYIHLYEASFDPLDQLTNLLAGDDDGPGGIGTSQIENIALSTGVDYILVTSGFAAGDAGAYTNTITGGPPAANPMVLMGDTSNGPTWDRPIGAGPSISGLGPVNYDAMRFTLVPEPSALGLLAVGMMLLVRRR